MGLLAPLNDADIFTEADLRRLFGNPQPRTWRRYLRAGKLPPYVAVGRKKIWRREAVLEFLRRRETPSGQIAPQRARA